MKKYIIVLLTFLCLSVTAQQQPVLKNKRGILILPQKGDYCLGISANPFFSYFGNMFNNSSNNNSPAFTFASPNQMLFLKYMKANDLAYRANFRVGVNNNSLTFNVLDVSPGAPINAVVSDVQKYRNNTFGLSFGIERRKGNTRLQGIYGVEGFMNYNSSKILFDYGNNLKDLDTGVSRVRKNSLSSTFSIGLRGFAGVEYFVAPNVSIGGELGFGPSFIFRSAAYQTDETYDFTDASTHQSTNQLSPKTRGFSLDTDNYNGIIKILFYF